MIIIVLLWLALIFAGIKYDKIPAGGAFGKENSLALRGICSIEIMLGHLGVATDSVVLFPNRKAGILFVGVFFALSGYGLMYSLEYKDNYLKHFLLSRMPKLLLPAYIIYAVGMLIKAPGKPLNIFRVDMFFEETSWYVWEMLAMYIVFYVLARLTDLKKSHVILLILSAVFVCIAYALNLDRPWYGSTFCFWLGIFYFINMKKFREIFVLRNWVLKIIVFGVLMAVSMGLFFIKEDWLMGDLLGRNIASLSFVLIVIICMHRFRLGNKISLGLGKYSYEIFLIHPIAITILRPYINDNLLYSTAVIALSVTAAFVYYKCEIMIRKKLIKKS